MTNSNHFHEELVRAIESIFSLAEDVLDEFRVQLGLVLVPSLKPDEVTPESILEIIRPAVIRIFGSFEPFAHDLETKIITVLQSSRTESPKVDRQGAAPPHSAEVAKRRLDRMMDPYARTIARGMGFRN